MEVTIKHLGEVQFEVQARNHTVYSDQPTDAGGYDEGMTPPEFFLASLGTCAGYYAVKYMTGHKIPTEGLTIRITAGKAKAPSRLDDIRIVVNCTSELTDRHREGVNRAVNDCLIHNTLTHPPRMTTEIQCKLAPSTAALAA